MAFYARESCGWCTPCRDGLPWAARIMNDLEHGRGRMEDLDVLRMTVEVGGPRGRAFCDLMGGAMAPLGTGLTRFRDLFEAHVREGCCPIARDYGRAAA
jgi:NADH-quinone oxidoreductase subunit F